MLCADSGFLANEACSAFAYINKPFTPGENAIYLSANVEYSGLLRVFSSHSVRHGVPSLYYSRL